MLSRENIEPDAVKTLKTRSRTDREMRSERGQRHERMTLGNRHQRRRSSNLEEHET